MVLTFFNVNGLDRMDREGYELRPIRNTNLFFILKIRKNIKDDQCCSAKVCILSIFSVNGYDILFLVIMYKFLNVDVKWIELER